jgi:hypothetical protein
VAPNLPSKESQKPNGCGKAILIVALVGAVLAIGATIAAAVVIFASTPDPTVPARPVGPVPAGDYTAHITTCDRRPAPAFAVLVEGTVTNNTASSQTLVITVRFTDPAGAKAAPDEIDVKTVDAGETRGFNVQGSVIRSRNEATPQVDCEVASINAR